MERKRTSFVSVPFGQIWLNMFGFGQFLSDMVGFGQIWYDLIGFARIWSELFGVWSELVGIIYVIDIKLWDDGEWLRFGPNGFHIGVEKNS